MHPTQLTSPRSTRRYLDEAELGRRGGPQAHTPRTRTAVERRKRSIGFLTARYMWDIKARTTFKAQSFVLIASFPIPSIALE